MFTADKEIMTISRNSFKYFTFILFSMVCLIRLVIHNIYNAVQDITIDYLNQQLFNKRDKEGMVN